jgi:hypothetical protein
VAAGPPPNVWPSNGGFGLFENHRHYTVDLSSIFNAFIGKGLRQRNDGRVDGRGGREAELWRNAFEHSFQ